MPAISYARHQFPPVLIQHAIWLALSRELAVGRAPSVASAMSPISYVRHHFPPDVIRHAVWLALSHQQVFACFYWLSCVSQAMRFEGLRPMRSQRRTAATCLM